MRALYVPTPAMPERAPWLVAMATAPAIETGGTLTCYAAADSTPAITPLTREQLRRLLREWAAADRDGRGLLEIAD